MTLSPEMRLVLAAAIGAPLLSCGERAPTQPGTHDAVELQIVITSPSLPATAPVGTTVPPVSVQVLNKKNGQIIYNEPVSFVVTAGGGAVYAPTVQTDNMSGIAQDLWTLGTRAGFDTLQARVVDTSRVGPLSGSSSIVTFAIRAVPLAASAIGVQAGNGQTAVAGSVVAIPPAVLVTDRFGNPIAGVSVTFAIGSGGGTVAGASQTTNASGIATVGNWTLGPTVGPNTLTASSTGITGSPVTFTATGINAAAAQLIPGTPSTVFTSVVASTIPAATGPAVRVVDPNNNGVPNVAVTFTVTGPTCPSCTPYLGTSPSAPANIAGVPSVTVLTDATGRASGGGWTLSTLAGANTLQATAVALSGSPVIFTATGTAGPPALLFKKSGDGQSASVGAAVAPVVQVTDVYGNPSSSGTAVIFTVQSGGGSIGGVSSATVTTDVSGSASVAWTLGAVAGTNAISATALSKAVTFTATATGPAGLNITNYAGDAQTQPAGTGLPIAPAAQVTDQSGHPVAGVQVTFSVTAGGGNITGPIQLTNASGVATVGSWTLGAGPGVNELQAAFNTSISQGYTIFVATGVGPGVVTSLADDGSPGTLRRVLATVPAGTTITFADNLCRAGTSCSIFLRGTQQLDPTGNELLIGTSLTIRGPFGYQLILDGQNELANAYIEPRVLHIAAGVTVGITNLSVSHGNGGRIGGGGIWNEGTLTLTNITVRANSTTLTPPYAGGIRNESGATLSLVNSTVSGNMAQMRGGGIENSGTLTLTNSTVSGNTASLAAGISNFGTLTLTGSTVSGNTATSDGGGIGNFGTSTLTNTAVSANMATAGGGIWNSGGALSLSSSVVSGNVATETDRPGGGGILNTSGGSVSLTDNTSVCNNTLLPNIVNRSGTVVGTNSCAAP